MSLQVQTRTIGNVAILQCSGRIVAGPATDALDTEVRKCFDESLSVVLDLGQVTHIDSSGLGLLVRLTCAYRSSRLGMKLCSTPAAVQKLIQLTNLTSVLPHHDSTDDAIRALNIQPSFKHASTKSSTILCVHESLDVLAWLRESLDRAGYEILTASTVPNAMIFIKARIPQLVLTSPTMLAKITPPARDRNIALLELDSEIASQDPVQALDALSQVIQRSLAEHA